MEIRKDAILIEIQSTPKSYTIPYNEDYYVDLDADGSDDIIIRAAMLEGDNKAIVVFFLVASSEQSLGREQHRVTPLRGCSGAAR